MKYTYESKLAPYITGLIEQKQTDGFSYDSGEALLKRFDRFCLSRYPDATTVTFELAAEWTAAGTGLTDAYRNTKVSIVKQLSIYILSLGHEAYLPDSLTVKAYRPALYIPTRNEVQKLLSEMDKSTSHNPIQRRMNKECKVLFLLYYCCGLRLSEGRLLKKENIDLETGILTILGSKGQKDRLVYLPDDGIRFLNIYKCDMESAFPESPWMFPGFSPEKPISCTGVESCFNRFWGRLPEAQGLKKHPTPHCLRHAFVVERINEWMAQGLDTNKMLPYLSRYLGHKSPDETYYYYHLAEQAFDVVRQKDSVSKRVIPEVKTYEE